MLSAPTVVDTMVRVTIHPPATPGGSYSLSYFPRRRFDTIVYYTPQGKPRNPQLAREVSWTVSGLQKGQTLTMEQKADSAGKGRFTGPFRVTFPETSCHSGEASAGPRTDSWRYSITLSDEADRELAIVDPEIIVQED
jgi:hypothetical protein